MPHRLATSGEQLPDHGDAIAMPRTSFPAVGASSFGLDPVVDDNVVDDLPAEDAPERAGRILPSAACPIPQLDRTHEALTAMAPHGVGLLRILHSVTIPSPGTRRGSRRCAHPEGGSRRPGRRTAVRSETRTGSDGGG